MKLIISIMLILLVGFAPQTIQAKTKKKGVEKSLSAAWNQRNKEPDAALKTAQEALAGDLGEITKEQKISAYDLLNDIYWKKHAWDKVIAVLDQQLKTFPQDKAVDRKIIFRKCDAFRQKRTDYDKIVQQLHDFAERNKNEPELCAEILLRSADFLRDSKKYPESYTDAEKALKLANNNIQLEINSLWKMQEAAQRMENYEKRCQVLLMSLQPKYRKEMRYNDIAYRVAIYSDSLMKLKRFNELQAFLRKEEDQAETLEHQQEWCIRIANSLYDQKKYSEALDAYERVFTDHPAATRYWRNAQDRRVDILCKLGKPNEALQEMRVLFDDCQHEGDVRWACERIANLFREIDKNNTRVDNFIAFQILGPAGIDEKSGTEDDLVNPLTKVPYPQYNNRKKAFAKAISESGDSYDDATYRGMAYLYTGQPKIALLHFMDAFRRYSDKQFNYPVLNVVLRGLRAVKMDSHSVPNAIDYILYGPNGKDGKKGTDDDTTNPFKDLGLTPAQILPSCSKAEKTELNILWSELAKLAGNPKEDRNRRKLSIKALRRIYETIAIDPEQVYESTLCILQNGVDRNNASEMLSLGLAASRKYQLSLVPFESFKQDLNSRLNKTGESIDPKSLDEAWKNIDRCISTIKKSSMPPKLRLPKQMPKDQKKKKKKKK